MMVELKVTVREAILTKKCYKSLKQKLTRGNNKMPRKNRTKNKTAVL